MLGAAPSLAENEVVGRVVSMTSSRIIVRSNGGETHKLDLSEKTRIFNNEIYVPVKRILPDTYVRVAHKNGKAEAIFIKAVPK